MVIEVLRIAGYLRMHIDYWRKTPQISVIIYGVFFIVHLVRFSFMPLKSLTTNDISARIGTHHFAYLRAVAEGLDAKDAAKRYLGIEHGAESTRAHRLVVERVRAVARRRGDPRWRLIGIEIRDAAASPALAPPLHDWAENEGLSDWSESELQEMYAERFGASDRDGRRRQVRNARLRARRLQLLRELEAVAAEQAKPSDRIDGWLPPHTAQALLALGITTLDELQQRIRTGGRWWRGLPAFGPVKAGRLAHHVAMLLGSTAPQWSPIAAEAEYAVLSGRHGSNRIIAERSGIDASDDRAAVRAWISSRAGSPYTAKQYEREAERFILFCVLVRRKALSDAVAEDCRAYMDLLANIPATWISRHKAERLSAGWAPFRGQLSTASQNLAVTALHSLFAWLVDARYLASNPWALVNRKLGDNPDVFNQITSRAFTPQAWSSLLSYLDTAPPTAASHRLRWLLVFVECTGLRAAELLHARREHFVATPGGWLIQVRGKGRRNRVVPLPGRALDETVRYFSQRGLDFLDAPANAPLLASVTDGMTPIGYAALHETFTRFVRRALAEAPDTIKNEAIKASAHWLRHTHATRAAERSVPPDVLQENLGQSDPRTTARYYRAQLQRRQKEIAKAFDEQ